MRKYDLALVIVSATALAVFAIVTANVLNGQLDAWNYAVYSRIALLINPGLTQTMISVSFAGRWYVYLTIAVLLLLAPKTRRRFGIPIFLTLGAGMASNYILKYIFAVPRPDINRLASASGYGHPSGHVMYGMAFVGMCAFLLWQHAEIKPLKIGAVLFAALFVPLMGFNRIYLGVHTATDVVAGYFAGIVIIASGILIMPKLGLLELRDHV